MEWKWGSKITPFHNLLKKFSTEYKDYLPLNHLSICGYQYPHYKFSSGECLTRRDGSVSNQIDGCTGIRHELNFVVFKAYYP